MAPAARASSEATASSRWKRICSLPGFIFGFNGARGIADRFQGQINVCAGGAKIYDARAQTELAAQHCIREVSATTALHPMHDSFVQPVECGNMLPAIVFILRGFNLRAQPRGQVAKATNT